MFTVKSLGDQPVVINSIPFTIEEKRVLRELRIPRIQNLSEMKEEAVGKAIKTAIDAAYTLIQGRGCYRTFRIEEVREDRVTLAESDTLFVGNNMLKLLRRCDYASLLACTIGARLEERIEELKGAHISDAYFLDVVGSWMADYMADRLDAIVQTEVSRSGYGRTMRYSPGYGDWDLRVQAELLGLVGASAIGVGCTDSSILQPRKSVTAVIGWERRG